MLDGVFPSSSCEWLFVDAFAHGGICVTRDLSSIRLDHFRREKGEEVAGFSVSWNACAQLLNRRTDAK